LSDLSVLNLKTLINNKLIESILNPCLLTGIPPTCKDRAAIGSFQSEQDNGQSLR